MTWDVFLNTSRSVLYGLTFATNTLVGGHKPRFAAKSTPFARKSRSEGINLDLPRFWGGWTAGECLGSVLAFSLVRGYAAIFWRVGHPFARKSRSEGIHLDLPRWRVRGRKACRGTDIGLRRSVSPGLARAKLNVTGRLRLIPVDPKRR